MDNTGADNPHFLLGELGLPLEQEVGIRGRPAQSDARESIPMNTTRLHALFTAAAMLSLPCGAGAEFGDIVMDSFVKERGSTPVVFSHAKHRAQFLCNVCHANLGFAIKTGDTRVEMSAITEGRYCGACHNGKIAWAAKDCKRCHVDRAPAKDRPPTTKKGERVDWVELLHQGKINPRANLEGTVKQYRFDLDIDFPTPKSTVKGVRFSHAVHTEWLSCSVCHPAIFETKRGANRIVMEEIARGEACGVCHMRVAFPVVDCTRCHSVDKKPG